LEAKRLKEKERKEKEEHERQQMLLDIQNDSK
jgi:hypothetical protein